MNCFDEIAQLLELMPLAMSIVNPATNTIICTNMAFQTLLDIPSTKGQSLMEIIKLSDVDLMHIDLTKHAHNSVFVVLKTKNGTLVPAVSSIALRSIGGEIYHVYTFRPLLQPISSQHISLDMEIRDSIDISSIQNYLEALPIFTLVLSQDHRNIVFGNELSKRIIGNPLEHVETSDLFYDLEECSSNQSTPLGNITFDTIIGSKWFRVTTSPILWANEKECLLVIGTDITKVKKLENKLLKKASTDQLTQIYSKQAGLDFLNDYIELVSKEKSKASLCYVEIPNLKDVSEVFGSIEGDHYILTIVQTIKSTIRHTDIFSRIYGAGFFLIFPDCVLEVAENIMGTILNKIDYVNTQEPTYPHYVHYATLELNEQTIDTPEVLLKKLYERLDSEHS